MSPSSRRAWIEILLMTLWICRSVVALLAEGVDRNLDQTKTTFVAKVALLAEGVDRNHGGVVALHGLKRRPPRGGRG